MARVKNKKNGCTIMRDVQLSPKNFIIRKLQTIRRGGPNKK